VQIGEWIGDRRRLLVMNREDQISNSEKTAWKKYFKSQGQPVVWTNGQAGDVSLSLTVS
jgi:ribosome biogenesis GTPase A